MATSAPSLRHASHFSAEPAVMITRAPNDLASWIAVVPMPDEPPWTSSVSPAFNRPRSKALCQTVKQGLGDRGGRDEREARRHRQRMAFVRRTIFGVTAADHERHHLIAELPPLHACAQRDHFACDLETGNVGRAGRRRI